MKVKPDLSFGNCGTSVLDFRRTNSLCTSKCKHQSNLCHLGADPHNLSYFLDTATIGRNYCATHYRIGK